VILPVGQPGPSEVPEPRVDEVVEEAKAAAASGPLEAL
jgi:hypothetical protein